MTAVDACDANRWLDEIEESARHGVESGRSEPYSTVLVLVRMARAALALRGPHVSGFGVVNAQVFFDDALQGLLRSAPWRAVEK